MNYRVYERAREKTRITWGTERRTGDRHTDRDEQRDGRTERRTDKDGQMTDGWMERQTNRETDGQRNGQTERRTDDR